MHLNRDVRLRWTFVPWVLQLLTKEKHIGLYKVGVVFAALNVPDLLLAWVYIQGMFFKYRSLLLSIVTII